MARLPLTVSHGPRASPRLRRGSRLRVAGLVLAACGAACERATEALPPPLRAADGLVVEELALGRGEVAAEGRYVALHYVGRIAAAPGSGAAETVFDATPDHDPLLVKVGGPPLLEAFARGLVGMREGGIRRLTLPPTLAYGDLPKGAIPPGSTLVWDVELVALLALDPAGFHWRELAPGRGDAPREGDTVELDYRLWTRESGRELASGRAPQDALRFVVGGGGVLPGLDLAVRRMRTGGRWQLVLPPPLAYGPRGTGHAVLPDQDVLAEVTLTRVTPPQPR